MSISTSPVLPDSWERLELRNFTQRGKKNAIVDGPFGSNLKTEHYRSSGIPIVTSGFVTDGVFKARNYLFVDGEKFNKEKRSAVYPGDIVMAKIGARCGASAILPRDHPVGILSGNALKISIDTARHSTEFVASVLGWLYERGELDELRSIGAQPAISMPLLKRLQLPAPPLAEQRAIVKSLRDADATIRSEEALIAKKQSIKQGMMHQLLTGKTRLPGFTADWQHRRVGEFADVTAGGTPSTSVPRYWGGPIRWMSSGELHQKRVTDVAGRITENGLRESSAQMLPFGSVLIGLAGQGKTRGTVAISRVVLSTNQSIAGILPSNEHSPEFLYYNLDTRYEELRGMSTGEGGRGGLNLTIIRSVPIFMPDMAEQTAIADVLVDIDEELDAMRLRLTKAKAIKQGMMQQLLTGNARLSVSEPAS